jgi:hypothetical protein
VTSPHLKQGKAYPDPIATAKATGVGYEGTAKHVEITPCPDSKPSAHDGGLSPESPNTPDSNRRGWRPVDAVTARNTYTGPGGSKR